MEVTTIEQLELVEHEPDDSSFSWNLQQPRNSEGVNNFCEVLATTSATDRCLGGIDRKLKRNRGRNKGNGGLYHGREKVSWSLEYAAPTSAGGTT